MTATAQGQQASPDSVTVSLHVDRERMTIGDPVGYTVAVTSPENASVTWPEESADFGAFEVLSFMHDGPYVAPDGHYADTLRYVITVYSVGVHTIPPFLLPYTMQDGVERTARADSVRITVVSVITDEATDIRDLKQPTDIPVTVPWYVWIGLAIILLALIFGGIYLYRRRARRLEEEEYAPPVPRLPHEAAYDELEQLARFRWIEQNKIQEHYTVLSEIIRRYVAARYHVAAMEITTSELVIHLGNKTANLDHIRMIDRFLQECDLVKFAKYIPDVDVMRRSIDEARKVVDRTRDIPGQTAVRPAAVSSANP